MIAYVVSRNDHGPVLLRIEHGIDPHPPNQPRICKDALCKCDPATDLGAYVL
ncbi:uncharacterized protein EI90DRAFT_3055577 [Cantharellus anzutake]|uniref:uncharacterized protein n=1 Tax=Cantharellus anzutake TaxID=1750568 RepID=UPI0019036563|nr:uncharacterized protein EI90DRAFT_3055577 [Cantharellus anzutake]KAF8332413.1 hypothetical protein EI90DRAFT_3055577 [Cantharellus anzutake]